MVTCFEKLTYNQVSIICFGVKHKTVFINKILVIT